MSIKKAVLVCSNAGLDYLDYPKDIQILRSVIHFGTEETYDDFVEMDAKTFYERIDENPNDVPKTSYVSIGRMQEIFEDLEKNGYEEALIITIAKPLSGLYEALLNQAKSANIKITVFDSRTIAYAEAYQALEAHRLFEKGYTMDQVIKVLEQIRSNNKWYFAVDTLKYLVKNGRLTKLQGTLGTLLKIKPLLTIDETGKVQTLEKIKTTPKALNRVLEKYFEETKDKNVLTYISHAHNDAAVKYVTEEIKKVYPNREIISTYLTPVVGAHTGPKALGLGYILLDEIKY
ncbi:DegV family protein [Haploplasma axanthum]|uniref:EDD domain-containing protein, DegV family n=1 Tax=Haploplasma axanthum TaxID=29552 RepID=A0A449BD38_HAPAX|nr:DegV family protein [Haploplasma axanthum]VEU80345.1 EDD domain-containing protein, DegV family [Haploplasma axanthum]